MRPRSPSTCPVCRPHVSSLQRYFDGLERPSVGEALAGAQRVVEDIRRSGCGVPPQCILLPLALQLLLRDDLDESTRSSLQGWVDSLGPVLTEV